jgi:predicted transcriptional regulator
LAGRSFFLEKTSSSAYAFAMSLKTITFEASEAALATIDEIAVNMEVDRNTVLREALEIYLAQYELDKAEAAEVDRQFEAGETLSHEEVMAKYETWKAEHSVREAA